MKRATKIMVAAVVGPGLVVSGFALGQRAAPSAADPDPGVPPATAVVERRPLHDTIPLSGDVRPTGAPFAIADRTAGQPPVVTANPAPAGGQVERGSVVAEVSGRPVVLLQGTIPAYRSLGAGVIGADVRQVEDNLAGLGLLERAPGERFDDATSAALGRLYVARGYDPPPDGGLPLSEYAVAPGERWTVLANDLRPGQAPMDPLVTVGSGTPSLHAATDRQSAARLRVGMPATVTTASGTYRGAVAEIRLPPDHATADAGPATVVVATDEALPASDVGGSGRAEVVIASTGSPVLVVPVTALRLDGAGADVVTVVGPDGGSASVRVDIGLVAGGAAAVLAAEPALEEGALVVVGG